MPTVNRGPIVSGRIPRNEDGVAIAIGWLTKPEAERAIKREYRSRRVVGELTLTWAVVRCDEVLFGVPFENADGSFAATVIDTAHVGGPRG